MNRLLLSFWAFAKAEIDALAKEIEEYNIIKSIPGIGGKIAATIISEAGEIDRFTSPKNLSPLRALTLVSLNQVNLELHQNRITKRSSSRLRHALYMAVGAASSHTRKA
ncbi:transposase [Niallia sp. MER 6]|uniref:transposase n=1 Tax=Niallia sp. MER 6 TaxID=2939567 RepID=UPI00203AE390|nr:transposase [Niallia sp. MER 6]MCM3033842.1 transposase [Niallia sp. MER 6]